MKNLVSNILNNSSEFSLTAYIPQKFLKNKKELFSSYKFSLQEKLMLYQIDNEGALYAENKFSPGFLKKLDMSGVGYFAFVYKLKDSPPKYAVILKSMRIFNPSFIPLK